MCLPVSVRSSSSSTEIIVERAQMHCFATHRGPAAIDSLAVTLPGAAVEAVLPLRLLAEAAEAYAPTAKRSDGPARHGKHVVAVGGRDGRGTIQIAPVAILEQPSAGARRQS
jgi:hypothetical protein